MSETRILYNTKDSLVNPIPAFPSSPSLELESLPRHVRKKLGEAGLALVFPVFLLCAWDLSARYELVPRQILPAPQQVGATLIDLIQSGELIMHLRISLLRVLEGLLLGSVTGVALGVAMGLSRTVEAYIAPLFKAFSSVPLLGWVPLVILLAGIGEALKIVIIAKACFTPMVLNTLEGIRNTPKAYIEVARVFQFNRFTLLRKVILPAALPSIFSGANLALGNAWVALVAVELLASSEGIGFMLVWGRQLFQMDVVFAAMIAIGVVGLVLTQSAKRLEAYLLRWRRSAF
jgi:sulfonate transport system permease protein